MGQPSAIPNRQRTHMRRPSPRDGARARARARARSPGDVVHLAVCDEPAIIRGRVLRDLHSLGTTAHGAAVALESAQGRGRRGRELKQRGRVGGSRSRRSALHATHLLHRVHGQACVALGRRSLVGFVEVRGALGERRTLILVGRAARQPAPSRAGSGCATWLRRRTPRAPRRAFEPVGAQRERGGARLPPSRRRPRAPSSNPSPRSLSCIPPPIGVSRPCRAARHHRRAAGGSPAAVRPSRGAQQPRTLRPAALPLGPPPRPPSRLSAAIPVSPPLPSHPVASAARPPASGLGVGASAAPAPAPTPMPAAAPAAAAPAAPALPRAARRAARARRARPAGGRGCGPRTPHPLPPPAEGPGPQGKGVRQGARARGRRGGATPTPPRAGRGTPKRNPLISTPKPIQHRTYCTYHHFSSNGGFRFLTRRTSHRIASRERASRRANPPRAIGRLRMRSDLI